MPTTTAGVNWGEAQAAVAQAAPRLTNLLRSVRNPDAKSVGTWNLTDVAVHISHAMDAVTAVVQGGGGLVDDVWDMPGVTAMFVASESERDLEVLADRIEASVANFLELMRDAPADDTRTWLVQGLKVPLSFATCHILNELAVHGRDIAVADGQPWTIDRKTATLILEGFVLPVLGGLGSAMVEPGKVKARKLTYDIRLRGGGRHQFLFTDGQFEVRPGPPVRPVDVHLSVDPETFLLVSWNRVSQWTGIAKGQLFAYGRKPWLGLQLRGLLKNP